MKDQTEFSERFRVRSAILSLIAIGLGLSALSCFGQSTPTSTSICNVSGVSAAMKAKYCGSNSGSNTGGNTNDDYGAAQRAQAAAAAEAQRQRDAELEQQRIAAENHRRMEEIAKQARFIADRDATATTLRGSNGVASSATLRDSGLRGSSAETGLRGLNPESTQLRNDDSMMGSTGYRVSKPNLTPVARRAPGNNTKAGDQLVSAGAAAAGGVHADLSPNYEGGARYAGSLHQPAVDLRGQSIDPATFTDRERNAPGMPEALNNLSGLQDTRSRLEAKLKQATAERNAQKDPIKMAELTAKVDQENKAYQSNLKAIHHAEATVKKIKLHVDTQ